MPHPDQAFAFNELSCRCCGQTSDLQALLSLLNSARAWHMAGASDFLKLANSDPEFESLRRDGRYRDKIEDMIFHGSNTQPRAPMVVRKLVDVDAVGLSLAFEFGGWAVSWPCECDAWSMLVLELSSKDASVIECRNISSLELLKKHWNNASRLAKRRSRGLRWVERIDNAQNESQGEVPQIHLPGDHALNIDGTWKHGGRLLSKKEEKWFGSVGWVVPA
jgi:hypothetical protein